MAYTKTTWEDLPSTNTPITASNLNKIENQVYANTNDIATNTGNISTNTTNIATPMRPTIISRLIEVVREHCEVINDKDTLEELLTIVRNEKGRIEAPVGGHDDLMMGLAIAYEIRSQVSIEEEPITPYESFGLTFEEPIRDYGEKIMII